MQTLDDGMVSIGAHDGATRVENGVAFLVPTPMTPRGDGMQSGEFHRGTRGCLPEGSTTHPEFVRTRRASRPASVGAKWRLRRGSDEKCLLPTARSIVRPRPHTRGDRGHG